MGRLGVNALTRPAPARVELAGLVTMARFGGVATSWNNLRERRIALFILSSVSRHTRWALFETAGPAAVAGSARAGRRVSGGPARAGPAGRRERREAFYVKCDVDTHGSAAAAPALLVIGVALSRAR